MNNLLVFIDGNPIMTVLLMCFLFASLAVICMMVSSVASSAFSHDYDDHDHDDGDC